MGRISELQRGLIQRDFSCQELTRHYLEEISRKNSTLNAYIKITGDTALEVARRVDEKLARGGQLLALEGIPMTLKDNISTRGIETTCCSKILQGYTPIYDASVWELLQCQNAVLLGKTNMDEFAMGSGCETSCHGGAVNPHSPDHVAGGSSGGGAAAVGGGLAVYALGSDTGGSVRQPASFCGTVGLKPTYGAVSRYGLIAYASSLDQIGPIAASVEDAAAVYDVIRQKDERDCTCVGGRSASGTLKNSLRGKKIGVMQELIETIGGEIRTALENAQRIYQDLGAELIPVTIPDLEYALPVYYILASAEASSNLGRYDGVRYGRGQGFGDEVKRRILLGTFVLREGYRDEYYQKAQLLREKLTRSMKFALEACDMLLAPVSPTAFERGSSRSAVETYRTDLYTVPASLAGLPALSVPCGVNSQGLPIGLQLIGKAFEEAAILNAAWKLEEAFT